MKFNFYSDAGHGWLKVPFDVLEDLKITEKVSDCSYMRDNFAFLEEDADVSEFCNAMRQKLGESWQLKDNIIEHSSNFSKIRGYESYNYNKYKTQKKIIADFDKNPLYRKYVLITVIQESKSDNVDFERLCLKNFEDQSYNCKKWIMSLADTLNQKIKTLVESRKLLFQEHRDKDERIKQRLEELEKVERLITCTI